MNQPQYVYVLATYGEYGLEERVATIDRVSLPALLSRFLDDWHDHNNTTEATEKLAALLLQSDEDLSTDKHELMPGWGGVQLYVIELS